MHLLDVKTTRLDNLYNHYLQYNKHDIEPPASKVGVQKLDKYERKVKT